MFTNIPQTERPVSESFFTPPEISPPLQVSRPRPTFGTTASQAGASSTTASRVAAASALLFGAAAAPAAELLAGPSSSSMDSRLGASTLSPPLDPRQSSPHDSMSPPSPCPLLQNSSVLQHQPLTSHAAGAAALLPSRNRGRRNSRHDEPVAGGGSPGSSPHDSISPPDSPSSPNHRGDAYAGPFARHHQIMTASGCKYFLIYYEHD